MPKNLTRHRHVSLPWIGRWCAKKVTQIVKRSMTKGNIVKRRQSRPRTTTVMLNQPAVTIRPPSAFCKVYGGLSKTSRGAKMEISGRRAIPEHEEAAGPRCRTAGLDLR
jgi:hypothetical protein